MVSAGYEYMGGTCGSDIVSSAADVLEMRGVGGLCKNFICVAWSGGLFWEYVEFWTRVRWCYESELFV